MGEELSISKVAASDEELVHLALAGSLEGFEQLVRRYQIPLMRFLLARSIRRHDAEDLVQDTFLRAYQSLRKYNDAWPFKTWIFTLAYRTAISDHRRRKKMAGYDDVEQASDLRDGPLEKLEREESRERLWKLAERILTEPQFTVIWLYYTESLPTVEVARVMNRPWVWVKTSLHRARRKLQAHLEDKEKMATTISGENT